MTYCIHNAQVTATSNVPTTVIAVSVTRPGSPAGRKLAYPTSPAIIVFIAKASAKPALA